MHGVPLLLRARVRDVRRSGRRGSEEKALPLVLLPGTLCDSRVFGPLRERLPGTDARVVLTPAAGTMQQAAEQVLAEAPERFVLLGFSLGGMVAMEAALCEPERVLGLALVSTSPFPVVAERHGARRAAVEEARVLGLKQFVRERLWPDFSGSSESCAALPLLEQMAESLGHAVFAQQTEMALGRGDYRSRLSAVRCPVLVLAGEEDRVCPPAAQRDLAIALPDCTCTMLPGAGHFALLEKPDEVAAIVAAWFHTIKER